MATEDDCIAALREAAERLGESPTKKQYEDLGLTPASATIIRTMGGWNAAKEAAGLETNPSTGSRVFEQPDDVEVSVDTPWEDLSVDQRWYYRNREADTQYELERRQRLRRMIHDYKAGSAGCARCDESDPACLDFHHPEGVEKEMAVNKMVPYGYSRAAIREEMDRCVLLCANCHRVTHHDSPDVSSDPEQVPPVSASREALRRWTYAYRRNEGCSECGTTDPRCLQFHHVDPGEKNAGVGALITDGATVDVVLDEIERCRVVCANCHRKLHYEVPIEDEGSDTV